MNHSSNILTNASFEGFNLNFLEIMSSTNVVFSDHHYDDQMLSSMGPNVAVFDPTMAHFFPSAQECSNSNNNNNNVNMVSEAEIMVNSSHKVNKMNRGGKKRKRIAERENQKPKEVVHVRAKRGQATDSHSLAERLRREKINDKLRCLQDLVPGCYKTMGMAVMLDVIINYVRSLQNQIDFLSMKLSAASLFYDFNSSEAEAMEAMQGTTGYEAGQVMEKVVGDGYGGISQFQTAAWPL